MKKITLKITAFLLIAITAFQANAQNAEIEGALDADSDGYGLFNTAHPGVWKIKLRDEAGFLTIDNELTLSYQADLGDDAITQQFVFAAHPTIDNMLSISSTIPQIEGRLLVMDLNSDTPATTFATGQDALGQVQMRKIASSEDAYAANGDMPGQNQLFFRGNYDEIGVSKWEGFDAGGAYRLGASAVGETAPLIKAGASLRFKLIESRAAVASTKNFNASSLSISNPVNNQLTIKGIDSNITKLSVYNLLGSRVLTQNIAGNSSLSVNVSNLVSGMYIVKLEGANGAFSKKIIKQ